SLFSTIGILAALQERHRTGIGKHLDVAMYDALLTLLANYGGYFHATGEQPARVGSGHYFTVPYGTFSAADGQIALAVMTDASWLGVCRALELDALGSDERLRTLSGRFEHREHIYAILRPAMERLTVHELISRLDAADVPCAPVNDIG